MRSAVLLVALSALAGCASNAPTMSKAEEAKALKGGPMPAGTWDKIAATREKFNREHGAAATGGPTGG